MKYFFLRTNVVFGILIEIAIILGIPILSVLLVHIDVIVHVVYLCDIVFRHRIDNVDMNHNIRS